MATLDVQRKRSSPWPWILLVLILAGVGVAYYLNTQHKGEASTLMAPDSSRQNLDSTSPAPVP